MILLIVIAAIANAIMDTLKFRYKGSIFNNLGRWFEPTSWILKYKEPLEQSEKLWYYLYLYKPKYKERFMYSTTMLVFLTNAWHFFQFVMITAFVCAICLPLLDNVIEYIIAVICLKVVFGFVFEMFFSKLFVR